MTTPTPRTNAATYPADCLGATLVTHRDCARELEIELAIERAKLDWVFRNCKVTADNYTTGNYTTGNRNVYAILDREDLGAAMLQ